MQIIDADGHVNDRPCMEEISKYMPPGNRTQVFPAFDHIHFHFLEGGEHRSRTGTVGPKEWTAFMDDTGIDWTVVYPTAGTRRRPHHLRRLGGRCLPGLQQLAVRKIYPCEFENKRDGADPDSRPASGSR